MNFGKSVGIRLAAVGIWLGPLLPLQGADSLAGEPVGIHRLTLSAGPNFVSVPLHGTATHRGTVATITPNAVTVTPNPGWTPNVFAPRDGFPQYLVLVRSDASETPGAEGDWWTVGGNTADTLTLETRGEDLTTVFGTGSEVEVRRLTSFDRVFGNGASLRLIPDSNFDILTTDEDVIRFVEGTAFGAEVFYHDGTVDTAGYYVNGTLVGNGDGSTITLLPDQPLMVFRKSGEPPLEILLAGAVLETRFTHYLLPGPNAVGTVYPVPGPLETSNLYESGWVSDLNFDILAAEDDFIREVQGTGFGAEIFHYAGLDDRQGWYVNGVIRFDYAFEPTAGFIFFIQGPEMLRWRQNVAFAP